jgi:hypothetical protein
MVPSNSYTDSVVARDGSGEVPTKMGKWGVVGWHRLRKRGFSSGTHREEAMEQRCGASLLDEVRRAQLHELRLTTGMLLRLRTRKNREWGTQAAAAPEKEEKTGEQCSPRKREMVGSKLAKALELAVVRFTPRRDQSTSKEWGGVISHVSKQQGIGNHVFMKS